jgi:AAA15 family ATPase/GTPase
MKSHFIKNIAIENFKCFQNLQINGMERVNLVGGKNNVGKTAFLEAVELLVSSNETYDLAINIYNRLTRRQINNIQDSADIILDLIKEDETKIKISTENKRGEMYLNEQEGFGFEPEFDEEMQNIIPTTSLSLAINGNEKSIPVERLIIDNKNAFQEREGFENEECQLDWFCQNRRTRDSRSLWLVS